MGRHVITGPGGFVPNFNFGNYGGAPFQTPNTVWDRPGDIGLPGAVLFGSPTGNWRNFSTTYESAQGDLTDLVAMIEAAIPVSEELPVLAFGHSRFGQVMYLGFRTNAFSGIDPAHVRFVCGGNPERKYGGCTVINPEGKPATYPGPDVGGYGVGYGLPPGGSGDYELIDIVRQYDEWADYPNDFHNAAALQAIEAAKVHSAYSQAPKLGTDGLPVNWDDWAVHVEDNVTYLTAPTMLVDRPMPWLARLFGGRLARNHNLQIGFDDSRQRELVEQAYERPTPVLVPAKYR